MTRSSHLARQAAARSGAGKASRLREWLGEFAAGSLFILDEAHAAALSSQTKGSE